MVPFGLDNNSSASLASPFYNNAGINFNSDDNGIKDTGGVTASAVSAKTPSRQDTPGIAPQAPDSVPVEFGVGETGSLLPYIIAGGIALIVLGYSFFKK